MPLEYQEAGDKLVCAMAFKSTKEDTAPITPDGRYVIVRGRLWRTANPSPSETERTDLVDRLMAARRAVRTAKKDVDRIGEASSHRTVDEIKQALGERGPVWWVDGSPDLNRRMARNTLYADWYAKVRRS